MSDLAVVPELSGQDDELDLFAMRPKSRFLRLSPTQRYPVPPALTIPMMGELLDLEQSIREAADDPEEPRPPEPIGEDATEDDKIWFSEEVAAFQRAHAEWERITGENRRKAVAAINRAHQAVEELIQIETPGARISLDVNEIMVVIRWLVSNRGGATGAVVQVVETAGGAADEGDEETPATASPPGAPADSSPLGSEKPSSRRSSGGATRRTSRPAGGAPATGTTSG